MDSKLKQFFLRGAFYSLLVQLLAAALTFLTSLLIAWISNDEGFGIYSLVFTWISLFSVFALFGIDDLFSQQIPIAIAQNNTAQIKGLMRWGLSRGLLFSLLAMILLSVLVHFSNLGGLSQYAEYYYLALPCLPLFVLLHAYQSALRAQKQVILGQLADKIVLPIAFLAFLLIGHYTLAPVSDQQITLFRSLAFALAAAFAALLFYRYFQRSNPNESPIIRASDWQTRCTYFMAMSLLYAINTRIDIALLGAFHTNPVDIAHYNAALKFSDLLQIPFMGIAAVVTPMFARLYAEKQNAQLQSLYRLSTRIMFALTALGCLLFLLLGAWLLAWFGESFRSGYYCLVFLLIARLLHAFVGPANYLLIMSEQQKAITITIAISTVAVLALHCVCIPLWGINGAAYATIGGAVVFEAGMVWLAWKKLGIRVGLV